MHLRQRAEQVQARRCSRAGGFPGREMPVATLSETFQKGRPPMMYRNLLAMEAEELLRSYPADGRGAHGPAATRTTPRAC